MKSLLLVLLAACLASAQSTSYDADEFYEEFHHDEACLEKVPEGLSVPSMCFLYEYVGHCEENGFNPHVLSEYYACGMEFLSAEEMEMVDYVWTSPFGPAGAQANNYCSEMGYDITFLNEYATCMEHLFGIGYVASNEAFLGVDIIEQAPEIDWSYFDYYTYDPEESFGPDLPEDPMAQVLLLLHSISTRFVEGYNMCPYGEYMCSDRSCIPAYWECDGMSDCRDGSDELLCGPKYDGGHYYNGHYDDDWYTDPWFTCEYLSEEQWCDDNKDCEYDEGDFCYWDDDIDWEDPWYTCEYLSEEQWCDDNKDCEYDEGDFCYWDDDIDWEDPWYTCEYLSEDQWCNDIKDCEYDEGDFCDYEFSSNAWNFDDFSSYSSSSAPFSFYHKRRLLSLSSSSEEPSFEEFYSS